MSDKVYDIATQENRYQYVCIVMKTNCTDKDGHLFEWISFTNKEEAKKIKAEHPGFLDGIPIVKCTKCGKVKQSM